MEKLTLIRKGMEVYYNDHKLTINPQATKGPGREVVKIEGLPNSNGKKWISLNLLKEGVNEIECQAQVRTNHGTVNTFNRGLYKSRLTDKELEEVQILEEQKKELQKKIDDIFAKAAEREQLKPDLNVNPEELSAEDKQKLIDQLQKYLGLMA